MSQGNIVEVLQGMIGGVLDGEVSPSQAQAVNGTVSQIIKIARLKIEHKGTVLDSVAVKRTPKLNTEVTKTEDLKIAVYNHVADNGDSSFKEIAEAIGAQWQAVENIAKHEWFTVKGNRVSIAT